MSREVFLVLLGLASVGGLIFLIARLKLNPFIALLVTSLALGAAARS